MIEKKALQMHSFPGCIQRYFDNSFIKIAALEKISPKLKIGRKDVVKHLCYYIEIL